MLLAIHEESDGLLFVWNGCVRYIGKNVPVEWSLSDPKYNTTALRFEPPPADYIVPVELFGKVWHFYSCRRGVFHDDFKKELMEWIAGRPTE